MASRTIREIEEAFREMGLTELSWGQKQALGTKIATAPVPAAQIFIQIETTTTPLEEKPDAYLA